jgi:putative transposase
MRYLHGRYAQRFNTRHRTGGGHLFQGRYGSVRIKSDPQLWAVVRYVVLNPVGSRQCRDPIDYRWSSHRATVRGHRSPCADGPRLLEYFAAMGGDPRHTYRDFVSAPGPATG